MTRNVTEIQRRLIDLGFLSPGDEQGLPSDDGKFGQRSMDAYNRFLASKGKAPHKGMILLAELNANLFPEERQAPPPKKSNPIQDWLIGLAIKQAVEYAKGLAPMNILAGYKTYILAVLILLSSAAETFIPGLDIPGYSMSIGEAVMVSLALITGRGGAKADVNKALGN